MTLFRRHRPRYYHGGAPGLAAQEHIVSAADLGHVYVHGYATGSSALDVYDPSLVYISTDLDVAIGFAARYVDPQTAITGGGWVYEVTPSETPAPDPDWPVFPEEFLTTKRATIQRIIRRDVVMSRPEQVQLERRYLVWDSRDDPRYDAEGFMRPSKQMVEYGVTSDLLRGYGKWLPIEVIDPAGRYVPLPGHIQDKTAFIQDMYDRIPALASPLPHALSPRVGAMPICSLCGFEPTDPHAAFAHQIGEGLCDALVRAVGPDALPGLVRDLVRFGKETRPDEWEWVDAG